MGYTEKNTVLWMSTIVFADYYLCFSRPVSVVRYSGAFKENIYKKDMATSDVVKCRRAIARKALPIRELEKMWITNDEACALLGCKRDFLEGLRDAAEVVWAKIGNRCYYELASIHRMFERHKVPAKCNN